MLTVNGIKGVVTDVVMGGEAAKGQETDDEIENEMPAEALVPKFRLPFVYICFKKSNNTINIIFI